MFIDIMADTVVTREEPVFRRYKVAERAEPPNRTVRPVALATNVPGLDLEKNCESWFTADELEALKHYFARHVYRDGLTFHEWCIPRGLETISSSRFATIPNFPRSIISRVMAKLSDKGVSMNR